MKPIVFLFALMFLVPAAHAQTAIDKDKAYAYYQNCMAQGSPIMSKETMDQMCGCTAAHMMKAMTVEDINIMGGNDQAARDVLNKMVIQVYAPCIQFPAESYYYNTCITNEQTKALSRDPEGLCSCMATEVASYLQTNSAQVFGNIISTNPNITDPMTALTSDPAFTQFAQDRLTSCYQRAR